MNFLRKVFPVSDALAKRGITFAFGLVAQILACLPGPLLLILVAVPAMIVVAASVAVLTPASGLLLFAIIAFLIPVLGIAIGAIVFMLSFILGTVLTALSVCCVFLTYVFISSVVRIYFLLGAIFLIVFFVKDRKANTAPAEVVETVVE
jgi:hypothetical protein